MEIGGSLDNVTRSRMAKYIHIVHSDGGGFFCSHMIELFLGEKNLTDISLHMFLTKDRELFEKWVDVINVILVDDLIDAINTYGKSGTVIFIHGLSFSIPDTLRIHLALDKKIIWRTWGHDIRFPTPHPTNPLKTVYRYGTFYALRWRVRRFKCIACANIVDELKVKKAFGEDVPRCIFPYPGGSTDAASQNKYLSEIYYSGRTPQKFMRIMVGHSGFPTDKQLEILSVLQPLKGKNITICLPLVYGNSDYMKAVWDYAKNTFGNQCEILQERMPYEQYAAYINGMDVAVMAMEDSAGLGNIGLLVYFEKKIYLNRKGDISAAFDAYRIPYDTIDRLETQTPKEIFLPLVYPKEAKERYCASFFDSNYVANCLKKVFDRFN